MPFAVKQDIPAHPMDVGAFGAGAQIAHADGVAQAGEKTWPFHGISSFRGIMRESSGKYLKAFNLRVIPPNSTFADLYYQQVRP
jgi:hypothetical protein